MPTTTNGDVELYYETFGSRADPELLLVNGLGSQCINYADAVVREVRGPRLSASCGSTTATPGCRRSSTASTYTLTDMADDALAVLDAVGVERAHVMGLSMGGMIVQRLAIDHPERLLSMTSVMSQHRRARVRAEHTRGAAPSCRRSPRSHARSTSRTTLAARSRLRLEARVDRRRVVERAGPAPRTTVASTPRVSRRQMQAIMADGSARRRTARAHACRRSCMHGSRDTLIDPSGGRRTAELIPGARYVEIEGMGHDYPPAVWDTWVATWVDFVRSTA